MRKRVTVIKGDGIGPEIISEAVKVMKKVAAKYGHYGCVTAWRKALGYGLDQAQHAAFGKGVEKRLVTNFKRCFAAEFRQRIVSHAVSYNEYIFHDISSVFC